MAQGLTEPLPLKDIHLPEPVSWWPPAPGWWLLLLLLVLSLVALRYLMKALRRRRERRHLRRQALDELARIERELEDSGDLSGALEHTSVLMRRVALSVFTERGVAGRAGDQWAAWLRRTGPDGLDPDILDALATAPYRPRPDVQGPPLLATARQWIDHVTRHAGRRSGHGRDNAAAGGAA